MTETKQDKKLEPSLGDKIKAYETKWETNLPNSPWVARLDGHGFSKFTKCFQKPADPRITRAMIETSKDMVSTFHANAGFTFSDEITLVFDSPNIDPKTGEFVVMAYQGRIQKITSLMAGYATVRFNHYLRTAEYDLKTEKSKEKEKRRFDAANSGAAYFDCRIFAVEDRHDAMLAIYWRQKMDCYRNGVSALSMVHFSHKQLDKVSTADKIKMLESKGIRLDDFPQSLFYGTLVKKEEFECLSMDPRKFVQDEKTNDIVFRRRVTSAIVNLDDYGKYKTDIIFAPTWNKQATAIDADFQFKFEMNETGKDIC